MTPIRTVRRALGKMEEQAGVRGDAATEMEAADAFARLICIELALRHLTAEHGTQCRCPGCEVLREGT